MDILTFLHSVTIKSSSSLPSVSSGKTLTLLVRNFRDKSRKLSFSPRIMQNRPFNVPERGGKHICEQQ